MISIGLFLSRPVLVASADLTLFFPWRVFGWDIFQHWKVLLLNEACRSRELFSDDAACSFPHVLSVSERKSKGKVTG